MTTEVKVVDDLEQLAKTAAEYIIDQCHKAISLNNRFSIALSGGSTPKPLFELLTKSGYRERIDWSKVHIFWGDERCVPPEDSESNYRMARETLLDHVLLPPDHVYRIRGEADPAAAAAEYEQQVTAFFGDSEPRLDLILLGMGDDGHTASLFPGTPALDETQRWVIPNYVEGKKMWRITFTVRAINAARNVVFLVSGSGKAERLREVLRGPRQPHQLPSQLVNPTDGDLTWLVDKAAAARWQHE
jgi:6-phosphogluconolactonase